MAIAVAVDVGGTFTDLAYYDFERQRLGFAKAATTPHDFADGILACLDKAGPRAEQVEFFLHGTTIVINTVIERTGAKTAYVATRGFRDTIEFGRGNRPDSFDVFFRRLPPLVPPTDRFELDERIGGDGTVLRPLDQAAARALGARLRELGFEAVAVCFINAYRNPEHELLAGQLLAEADPELFVSLSHTLSREFREYERGSTAVVNAYAGPKVRRYLGRLETALSERGFGGSFFVMESNGGMTTAAQAREKPVLLIESGPVAGCAAAAQLGTALDLPNVVAFDMGGTTAKSTLIENGRPDVTGTYYVGGYNRGLPIQVPIVDVVEVGAGGGSIAWLDDLGNLKVGPRSAGAEPGPVCYGRGGTEPTVTDANLVLGRLDPERFLGGEAKLDRAAALRAIETRLAGPLGREPLALAGGMLEIVNLTMASAVRRVSVERGRDPRDFALIAYGGAGPLHACAIARDLSIPTVVVPPMPGHFSALGMLLADLRHDYVQTYLATLQAADLDEVEAAFGQLEQTGRDELLGEYPHARDLSASRAADMRYVGQFHTVTVALPTDFRAAGLAGLRAAFDETYFRRFGHTDPTSQVEIVNLRLAVHGQTPRPALTALGGERQSGQPRLGEREVFFFELGRFASCPIYRREALPPGFELAGPAIVEEYASTTVLHPGDRARVHEAGHLLIQIAEASHAS